MTALIIATYATLAAGLGLMLHTAVRNLTQALQPEANATHTPPGMGLGWGILGSASGAILAALALADLASWLSGEPAAVPSVLQQNSANGEANGNGAGRDDSLLLAYLLVPIGPTLIAGTLLGRWAQAGIVQGHQRYSGWITAMLAATVATYAHATLVHGWASPELWAAMIGGTIGGGIGIGLLLRSIRHTNKGRTDDAN